MIEGQKRGDYKVLPNDKSGGVTVVDLSDYKLVVQEQLSATYRGGRWYTTTLLQAHMYSALTTP